MSEPNPIRVVVADDAEQLRALLSKALERTGEIKVVAQVGDGAAALESVVSLNPDVLLLDLSMPVLDGLEVLRSIREAGHRTSIVVFSGYGNEHLAETCRRLGARAYLEKGSPLPEVRSCILSVAREPADE